MIIISHKTTNVKGYFQVKEKFRLPVKNVAVRAEL